MNNPWIRAQDRRRSLIAAGSTACIYALAFLGAWVLGLLAPVTLASVPGTVIVDLGGTEGPPGEVPLGLESAPDRPPGTPPGAAPLPAAEAPAAAAVPAAASASESAGAASTVAPIPLAAPTASAPEKAAPSKAAPKTAPKPAVKSAPKPAPASAKTISAKDAAAAAVAEAAAAQAEAAAAQARADQAAQADAALRAAAATAKASAAPSKTRTFGSSPSGTGSAPVSGSGTGTAPGVAGGTGSVTYRGTELGSALTTTFGASTGQVGRNIYVPIYLYMPLPSKIDDSIYRNVQAKETFRTYYQASGSSWVLASQVPLTQRGQFWSMLEAAGYDPANADYKTARKLQPVVLEFAVGPLAKGKVELVDVRLVSGSGSSEVDEAVIYGFRQASFFNKTGNAVGGKFVYGF